MDEQHARSELRAKRPINFQVLRAEWIEDWATLRHCRVVGDVQFLGKGRPVAWTWEECAVDGNVTASTEDESLSLTFSNVAISGWLAVRAADKGRPEATDQVRGQDVKIGGDLRMQGGGRSWNVDLEKVVVGGGATLEQYHHAPARIQWIEGRVNGDLWVPLSPRISETTRWESRGLIVSGRTIFRGGSYSIFDWDQYWSRERPPFKCEGPVTLENVRVARAHLTRGTFTGDVRINRCHFDELWLDGATFTKEVSIFLTSFGARPPEPRGFPKPTGPLREPVARPGLSLFNTRFEKKLDLAWDRLQPRRTAWWSPATAPTILTGAHWINKGTTDWREALPDPPTRRTWVDLAAAARASGNDETAREADYRAHLFDHGIKRQFGQWVWGFGHRPARPALWLVAVLLGSAGAFYARMPKEVAPFSNPVGTLEKFPWKTLPRKWPQRAADAFWLSLAIGLPLKWTDALEKTQGWWRALALTEWAAAKVLMLLFAKALANTSPLLKEITDKLLPFG